MRILVLGAHGFVGSYVTGALIAAGHEIICGARNVHQVKRRYPYLQVIPCNFIKDTQTETWLPRLKNIDAVVNCVGILQSMNPEVIDAVHFQTPRALVLACSQAKIKKFIHISALGADEGVRVAYAETKLKFENYLHTLDYNWVILRPSLVYASGSYGGTSLFRALSAIRFFIPVVGTGKQRFQPIHVRDLSKAIESSLEDDTIKKKTINVVGPDTFTIEEILILLRQWLGFGKAKIIHIPILFIRFGAFFGDWFSDIPINSTTYKMIEHDNTADVKPFIDTFHFIPSGFRENLKTQPSSVQDRWHARLFFLNPLLRVTLGFLWIFSGLFPLLSSHAVFYDIFSKLGITGTFAILCFYGSTVLDILLGAATILNWRLQFIGSIQILVILLYTLIITVFLPYYWLDPFGSIMKNIPLIVGTLMMMALSEQR